MGIDGIDLAHEPSRDVARNHSGVIWRRICRRLFRQYEPLGPKPLTEHQTRNLIIDARTYITALWSELGFIVLLPEKYLSSSSRCLLKDMKSSILGCLGHSDRSGPSDKRWTMYTHHKDHVTLTSWPAFQDSRAIK